MKIINLLIVSTMLVFSCHISSAFEVLNGEIIEITGPDDLELDPSNTVLAVDVFGNSDSVINDVEFFTDRVGLGAQVTSEGIVEKDVVSITTTATNSIDNWANAQTFTGSDADSTFNLSEVMRDIRWSPAPTPLTVDIAGLNSGSIYNLKLLFNEGADQDRGWDISAKGEIVLDNITSEGGDGFWSPENTFVYSGDLTADGDGNISNEMRNDINREKYNFF